MSSNENSEIELKFDDMSMRLKRVEDFLWPPTTGGGKPIDPTGGPGGPPFSPAGLDEVVQRLESIEEKVVLYDSADEELKKVWRELSELRQEVSAYSETIKALEKMMVVPAQ